MTEDVVELTVTPADTFFSRFRGLMFRKSIGPNEGFLLTRCGAIHTFFMRFDMDAIFLDPNWRVVKLCERVRPYRPLVFCVGAFAVLECRAGFIASNHITLKHALEMPDAGQGTRPGGAIPARFV